MKPTEFRESGRIEAQARARELEPSAIAVYLHTAHPNERCQIRVQLQEWTDETTLNHYTAIYGSGPTWVDALQCFANKMVEIAAAQEAGNELQRKLRERGLA